MHVGDDNQQPGHLLAAFGHAEFAALLDDVDVAGRRGADADDLGLRGLRLQDEGGEIQREGRKPQGAEHLAAAFHDHLAGIALEPDAAGLVSGQEEPGIAAAFDHLTRGPSRHRGRVEM
jgi:hypothetical protein